MITDYAIDEIVTIRKALDDFREVTRTEQTFSVTVERTDQIIVGIGSQERAASWRIFGEIKDIANGDFIRITKLNGTATSDTMEYPILRLYKKETFDLEYMEIFV